MRAHRQPTHRAAPVLPEGSSMTRTISAAAAGGRANPKRARCTARPRHLATGLLLLLLLPAFGRPATAQVLPPAPARAVAANAGGTSQAVLEQQKIDYLIASVAALKGASFIRNGTAYDAQHAAAHMQLKRRFAGGRISTAEQFIVYCATGSSMSGKPYTIRFADGHTLASASYLRARLAAFRPGSDSISH
jgi:hypothetical protein